MSAKIGCYARFMDTHESPWGYPSVSSMPPSPSGSTTLVRGQHGVSRARPSFFVMSVGVRCHRRRRRGGRNIGRPYNQKSSVNKRRPLHESKVTRTLTVGEAMVQRSTASVGTAQIQEFGLQIHRILRQYVLNKFWHKFNSPLKVARAFGDRQLSAGDPPFRPHPTLRPIEQFGLTGIRDFMAFDAFVLNDRLLTAFPHL